MVSGIPLLLGLRITMQDPDVHEICRPLKTPKNQLRTGSWWDGGTPPSLAASWQSPSGSPVPEGRRVEDTPQPMQEVEVQ